MNLLLDLVTQNDFILDVFGVIGLGLIGLAAVRLSKHYGGNSGTIMTWGALALIFGRIGILIFSSSVTPFNQEQFDPTLLLFAKNIPMFLLTLGLGTIVWGFWSHERETSEEPGTLQSFAPASTIAVNAPATGRQSGQSN